MSEKRFIKKDYDYDGCFFFDREQEFTDNVNKIPFYDVENLIPMTDEQVVELLNEQQATIQSLEEEIKLLKPTNIEQYEQIQKLQEENRELRKELSDCEKFRYQVFKRMNEEYIKECSIK